ncbi:MAG: SEC-C domain-containing protein [Chlamydiae bacterium]|nr:SEC-C domain-containing protein [Chlamydiota bacterium]
MTKKVGRNDPCPCGSGKKYKKCCEERIEKKTLSSRTITPISIKPEADKAKKISGGFFHHETAPKPEQPQHQPPHDHPDETNPI